MKNLAELPERSIVTVLAVDTVNSTAHVTAVDPDEAQELLDRIFAHLDGAVRRCGGMFVSFSGDGGVAVFGWPNSLEDHADRACEAAWLMQNPDGSQSMRDSFDRPIRFRVGVHSGLVGLRRMSLGADNRLDTVGGAVWLAAALQKRAAPGEILVSSKTHELCQSELKLAPHEAVPILEQNNAKVHRLEARPHRLTTKYARRNYRVSLVGRLREREAMRDVLVRQADGKRAVAVIGEPGIGKSRLISAAIHDAQVGGVSELIFYGDTQKRTTPYSAMRSLILEVLSLSDVSSDNDVVEALSAAGIDDLNDNPLATVMLAKRLETSSRSNSPTQTQVARALVSTLAKLTKGSPKLIVIEDLHLVDPESIHCLRLLAEDKSAAWRMLLTGRPEADADAASIANLVVRLRPLPREEMRQLAIAMWPQGDPPPKALETVVDRADGIPFVLEQIVLSIGTEGTDSIDLAPQSVQSVIHARLNRLPASAKACAQALSVLGEEVETEVALKLLGGDAEALQRDLRELEALEIIHPSSGSTVRFRHAIVAEATSDTLPRPRRQELHRAATEVIAGLYADLDGHHERLAFHAEGARDDEKALEHLWLAGLRARRSSANGSLVLIFQRAMQCIERIGPPAEPKFVDFVLMACATLLQVGEFRQMTPYLPRALELAQKQNRQDRVCGALCNMGTVSWFEGRYADSRRQCEQALQIAESLANLPLTFAAKFMLSSAFWGMADMDRAISLLHELRETFSGKLETARLGAIAIPSSMIHSYLSWFMMEVGRYEEGLTHTERALEIAVSQSEPYSELLARNGMGRNLLKLKRHRDAADCLQGAISLIEQYGYDAIRPHVTGQFAIALTGVGDAKWAVEMVEAWLALGLEERTGRLELYYLHAGYAEALAGVGENGRALLAADRALDIARSMSNPCLIVQGLGLRARLLGKTAQAAADLAEQAELCRRHGLVTQM